MAAELAPDPIPGWGGDDESSPRLGLIQRCVDAELALVSKMLGAYVDDQDKPVRKPVEVDAGEFVEPSLATAFKAINDCRAGGHHATPERLVRSLAGDDGFLALSPDGTARGAVIKLFEVQTFAREEDCVASWRRVRDQLHLWDMAATLQDEVIRGDEAAGQILDRHATDMSRVRSSGVTKPESLRSLALVVADRVDRPRTIYRTNLPALDEALGGGFLSGTFIGLQGRMKVGKTLWLSSLALDLALQGHRVAYYCFEMGQERIAERMIAAHHGGRLNAMAFLKASSNRGLSDDVRAYAAHAPENLLFVDRARPTLPWLKAVTDENRRRHKVTVHIYDYMQLIRGSDSRASRVDQQDEVADWMAESAKENDDLVMTATQLNRDGETRYGDSLMMAASQVFNINAHDPSTGGTRTYWLECVASRYTAGENAGTKEDPPFFLSKIGPRICQNGVDPITLIPPHDAGRLAS